MKNHKKRLTARTALFLVSLLLMERMFLPAYAIQAAAAGVRTGNTAVEAQPENRNTEEGLPARATTVSYKEIRISSADDLVSLSASCSADTYSRGKRVTLMQDIDLGNTDFTPIPTFGGIFDGNGHTIRNVRIDRIGSVQGLFRYIQESGTVKDLNLSGVILPSGSRENIGGIAGINYGHVEGCSFSGTVMGRTQTGGIAGLNEASGSIINCRMEGDISGEHFTGGIAGKNLGIISSCTNSGNINTSSPETKVQLEDFNMEQLNSTENVSSHTDTGGITGFSSGIVQSCTNKGNIGYQHTGYNVGGISGRQNGYLFGCYNQGAVLGRKDVGGITGQAEPYIMMEFSEDTLQKLDKELGTMHDLLGAAADHFSENNSYVSAQFESLTSHFKNAGESLHTVLSSTVEFANGTMNSVNDVSGRLGTLTQGADGMLGELNNASSGLTEAMNHMNDSLNSLQGEKEVIDALSACIKELLALFQKETDSINGSVTQTAGLLDDLSGTRARLGSYSSAMRSSVLADSTLAEEEKAALSDYLDAADNALSSFDTAYAAASMQAADAAAAVSSCLSSQSAAFAPLGNDVNTETLETASSRLSASAAYLDTAGKKLQGLKSQLEPCVNSLNRAGELLSMTEDRSCSGPLQPTVSANVLSPSGVQQPETAAFSQAGESSLPAMPDPPGLTGTLERLQDILDKIDLSSDTLQQMNTILKNMAAEFGKGGAIADSSLEYMKKAFAGMSAGFTSACAAIGTMHHTMSGLASRPDVAFPSFNSEGSDALSTFFASIAEASDSMSRLNSGLKKAGDAAAGDLKAINDQLQVILGLLLDSQSETTALSTEELLEDVSDSDEYSHKEGKVSDCVNDASVEGDINVGGIAGMMAQEYDFDPEDDIANTGSKSLRRRYKTSAVVIDCTNKGSITAKKDYAGGIAGRMDLGSAAGCKNYGPAQSTGGDYLGGIAGSSSSVIKNCYSLCSLTGNNYIGGIAGWAGDLQDCYSLTDISSTGEYLGAVAGYADGQVSGNRFVEDGFAGIDGISYAEKTIPMDYNSFIQTKGLPTEFSNFRLYFMADGLQIAVIPVKYGSSLRAEELPDVPKKEGFYGSWPDYDFGHITASRVLEAEYTPWITVIESDVIRSGSELPILLAEGEFTPNAVLNVSVSDREPQSVTIDGTLLEAWEIHISGLKSPDTAVCLRLLMPEREKNYEILLEGENGWKKVSYTEDGSYMIFPAKAEARIALVQINKSARAAVTIVLLLLTAGAALYYIIRYRKKKK